MKISLRVKTIILIVLIAAILGTLGVYISSRFIGNTIDNFYMKQADEISHMAAVSIDTEKAETVKQAIFAIYNSTENKVLSDDWGSEAFDAYTALYDGIYEMPEYRELLAELKKMQDVIDVDCLYTTFIDFSNGFFIYLVDAAEEDACPPGCIDPIYEENQELLTNPDRGFPPYITNTEPYGWLVTAGVPVYDAAGNIVCYAMVDISMETLRGEQSEFIRMLSLALLLMTVIICVLSIFVVNYIIIRPINQLSSAVSHYNAGHNNEIDTLTIKTQDEIHALYVAFKQMSQDISGYIENLINTNRELMLTREKADTMDRLAHKDAMTGVGSKLAYDQQMDILDQEIQNGEARFGIVMVDVNNLKYLNDNFGHEKGNIAICNVCKTICNVFSHSPVFRIGGDEFVVVLKERDYENRAALLKEFRSVVAENAKGAASAEPWNKVSAAIGCAVYTDEDTANDVFRKADHDMYENKKAMKAK